MSIGKFLIGCVLFVGGASAASAMDADVQDMGSMQRAVDSSSANHEGAGGGSSGGDALGILREGANQTNPSSSPSNDNCPSANPANTPRNRRATLGWQSLLPGSIQ